MLYASETRSVGGLGRELVTKSDSGAGGMSNRSRIAIAIWVIGIAAVLAFTISAFGGGGGPGTSGPAAQTTTAGDTDEIQGIAPGSNAPDATFELGDNQTTNIDSFDGQRILLWFPVSTCETCQSQAARLAENRSKLQNVTVIALTPPSEMQSGGPTGAAFAEAHAPETLNESNWYWGVPSQELMETYNPEASHGLGYLIDENGDVVARGSKPADSLDDIARFANGTA